MRITKFRYLAWSLALAVPVGLLAQDAVPSKPGKQPTESAATEDGSTAKSDAKTARATPKPLSGNVEKGLAYLAGQQNSNGGWGQGGGWRTSNQGRVDGPNVEDPSDVGNTCVAVLALYRAGNTPSKGKYSEHVRKGLAYIMTAVDKADGASLWVTDTRDTQLQSKIGRYVDTFLAALVLSEVKGHMQDVKAETQLSDALKKTIAKIEKNQQNDGTFAGNGGWATVLSQGLCSKALNRAAQRGIAVDADVLKRDFNQAVAAIEVKKGVAAGGAGRLEVAEAVAVPAVEVADTTPAKADVRGERMSGSKAGPETVATKEPEARIKVGRAGFGGGVARGAGGGGDAGVSIYSDSANTARLQELANTNNRVRKEAEEVLASPTASEKAKGEARGKLREVEQVAKQQEAAVKDIVARLDDKNFLAGFGNNGGEEFLSYMNISETMVVQGGDEWKQWDKAISQSITKVQNEDGSWSGHHCITGRTFCTSAALLTLMADRAPVPVAAAEVPTTEKK